MAKVLKQYTPPTNTGPEPSYPWEEWLDGKIRRLTKGDGPKADFSCSLVSMTDLVRKTAKKHGVKVSVFKEENGIVIRPKQK